MSFAEITASPAAILECCMRNVSNMWSKTLPSCMRTRSMTPTIIGDITSRGSITLLLLAVRVISLCYVTIVREMLWWTIMVTSSSLIATSKSPALSSSLTSTTIASSALSEIAESGLLRLLHVWHRGILCLCRWVVRALMIHLIGEIVWLVHCRIIVRLQLMLVCQVRLRCKILRCIATETRVHVIRMKLLVVFVCFGFLFLEEGCGC